MSKDINDEDSNWTCSSCTYMNIGSVKFCDVSYMYVHVKFCIRINVFMHWTVDLHQHRNDDCCYHDYSNHDSYNNYDYYENHEYPYYNHHHCYCY